jgi:hypothetical protein
VTTIPEFEPPTDYRREYASQGTVVLCGSVTRAVAALDAAERHYLALGYSVHKPVRNDGVAFEVHVDRWYQLIDSADLVVACTMQHEPVGEQTRREMERAFTRDIPVRLWVEKAPARRGTCPACCRSDRVLDPQGRIRFHHDGRTHAPIRCVGTGQRPDHAEERAS